MKRLSTAAAEAKAAAAEAMSAARSAAAGGGGGDAPRERISTATHIKWMKKFILHRGYLNTLYSNRWEAADESGAAPHPEQFLAALQIFAAMFVGRHPHSAWVHLAAEMQAGKSGVANALIRLVLANTNVGKLDITPKGIFVLTGMSDDAWKKQTKDRVPSDVRSNVHHSGGLPKVCEQLRRLGAKDEMKNLLIILDESQVASAANHRVNSLVYKTVREFAPVEEWDARNIRFLTVSATDPAKVMSMESCEIPCRTVRLVTTEAYQSVESLMAAKRIRSLETFGDIGSASSVKELRRVVDGFGATTPLWHILRPKSGKTAEVAAKLQKEFPTAQIVSWDSAKKTPARSGDDISSATSDSLADINDLLKEAPAAHSFVILKNMFYAAKTLNDTHVGVLWDRLGGNVGGDNARLQSLLGRACGYGKSSRTIVYTSTDTVTRYLGFWKQLCSSTEAETTTDEHTAIDLHRRFPGIAAVASAEGVVAVAPMRNAANPTVSSAANAVAMSVGRVVVNDSNYGVEWQDFASFAAAKVYASRVHEPTMDQRGYYLSSTTGKRVVLAYAEVMRMQGGKKTAGFGNAGKLAVGKSTFTMYVSYRDIMDKESVVFTVGKLTRNA
jgi:hypothetical protein